MLKGCAKALRASSPNEYFCVCSGTGFVSTLLPLFISKQLFNAEIKFGSFGLKVGTQNKMGLISSVFAAKTMAHTQASRTGSAFTWCFHLATT